MKKIFIACFVVLLTVPAFSQTLVESLDAITKVNEGMEKLFSFYKNINAGIKKDRVEKMATAFAGQVGAVIVSKDSIIRFLQRNDTDKVAAAKCIKVLEDKLNAFDATINSYSDLINDAGVPVATFRSNLKADINSKKDLLEEGLAIRKRYGPAPGDPKKELLTYLKAGSLILKNIQDMITKFKPQ